MQLAHLSLFNFRSYPRLELDLPAGRLLFAGGNAHGKTNLLEAVYLLATLRSPRTESDGDLISWSAGSDADQPFARVMGTVERRTGSLEIDLQIVGRRGEAPAGEGPQPVSHASRRIRVNGLPRRSVDAVGLLNAVLFSAPDIDLLTGAPSVRRRYLDLVLVQMDREYRRHAGEYARVLARRNALLRQLQERPAHEGELDFWDDKLVEHGSPLIAGRAAAVAHLDRLAAQEQLDLSGGREQLGMRYLPRVSDPPRGGLDDPATATAAFRYALDAIRRRETAAGMTLVGPHRDDVEFLLNGVSAGAFGSRAQQRTVALALRLAEARFLHDRTGESPVLLLDDILSEMDAGRREAVLRRLGPDGQVLITTAEPEAFSAAFLAGTRRFTVRPGEVLPAGR